MGFYRHNRRCANPGGRGGGLNGKRKWLRKPINKAGQRGMIGKNGEMAKSSSGQFLVTFRPWIMDFGNFAERAPTTASCTWILIRESTGNVDEVVKGSTEIISTKDTHTARRSEGSSTRGTLTSRHLSLVSVLVATSTMSDVVRFTNGYLAMPNGQVSLALTNTVKGCCPWC